MRGICPSCEQVRDLARIEMTDEIEVRGEFIPVDVAFMRCPQCDAEFRDPSSSADPLDTAYREYRRRHDMVQPEALRALRAKYDLTQKELADLLGWGVATISRYENGALQDAAHDRMLRLAMEPNNLLRLVRESPEAIEEAKRGRIVENLEKTATGGDRSLLAMYEERFGGYEPDCLNGYRRLILEKLVNAILFFCRHAEVPKTKLNKLLFYADFEHYRRYSVSITGLRYVRLPYGPVPDNYEHYYAALFHEEGGLEKEERTYHDYVGEVFVAASEPDLSVFDTSELRVLTEIRERFEDWTATALTDLSHEEPAYVQTGPGELIDYRHAESLSL